MGKGQVLFISVEGNDAALAEGLKAFQAGIALISGERTSPIEIAAPAAVAIAPELPENKQAEVTEIAAAISNRTIARAVSKVRRATDPVPAKSAAGEVKRLDPRVESGPLACDQAGCGRSFRNNAGLGIHRLKIHGIGSAVKKTSRAAASQPDRETLPCGVNGCLQFFKSHGFRERHWATKHPDKLRG